jgi:hypothetical protein
LGLNLCTPLITHALGHFAALIQQRIRHAYRQQRPNPLPSRTAHSCQGREQGPETKS